MSIIVNKTERKVTIEVNRVGIKGDTGKSAYQSYLDTTTDNPPLTEAEWSERAKGDDGKSAYEVAVEDGYVGSETDWLLSLKGADGATPEIGINGNWFINGVDSGVHAKGDDGDSAYQIWLDAGNTGSVQDYLDSLKGEAFTYEDFTTQQLNDLRTIEGEGKIYDTLAQAQAVDPKPANGTVFQVSKLDSANAGVYTFQSEEVGGVRFEKGLPVEEEVLNEVIDFPRLLKSTADLVTGYKVRAINGNIVADVNWSFVDLFPVEQGEYSISGFFDINFSVAAYDENGVYVEGYNAPTTSAQTYNFTISNPKVKKLIVSTHNSRASTFEFRKLNTSIAAKSLKESLGITDSIICVYVAKTGNDNNTGVKDFPFLTINKAIEFLSDTGGNIVVREGDYYETLNLKSFTSGGNFKLISYDFEKVRIMGSEIISGITKTAGRTNIYEAAFTGEILATGNSSAYGYRVFEDAVPSKEIPLVERSAMQRSQHHRLPYSEIRQITNQGSLTANLDFLDALEVGESGYWYDQPNGRIYIVNAAHSIPSSIHYAVRDITNAVVGGPIPDTRASEIEIKGVEFFYSKGIGLSLYRFSKVKIFRVGVFGARLTGFNEQASDSEVNMLECGGCGTDGLASALYFTIPSDLLRNSEVWNTYRNIWCHDNYDDGFSVHQNGAVNIDGFLFEHNGDTGLQNVGCSYSFVKNGVSRYNTKGIVINGGGTVSHSRNSTCLEGYNITSENNTWNFESVGDGNTTPAVMNLYNCVSRNGTNGYKVSDSNAVLKAHNCKSTGDTNPNNGAAVINDIGLI